MTQVNTRANTPANPRVYPLAPLPASALDGVRRRRIAALCLDLVFVSFLAVGIWLLLGVLSFGVLWFILPPIFPFVAFFYNGLTISGWRMATPGMKAMDLEMRLVSGERVPFLYAAVHAVLFYLCMGFPILFLFSLLSSDKRCLHDMLAGVIVLRRV
ncbi:RDD family protein [Rhodoblastus acidophilus]|jgi:uncharacterized RDD family membrane protein YckC|uniref:RDD family protein n=1 Tax=Rhodoblastus acidophilus TaxID=1074 RepID=A0A6N8DNN4_RHOAC|nr:RDD family protein [Rhodoblastus acidophilus]MCW2275426.1 putative RDD family membrane protein YckC [Rhodoblastus acidophilus]MTV32017.1 RDD family protein [Rhodoblastus acidophilus]